MNNSIFLAIRDIISGITPSIDVSHILYDHRCFYLLSLYNNSYSNLLTSKMAVNKLAISKRYRELSLFFRKSKPTLCNNKRCSTFRSSVWE